MLESARGRNAGSTRSMYARRGKQPRALWKQMVVKALGWSPVPTLGTLTDRPGAALAEAGSLQPQP